MRPFFTAKLNGLYTLLLVLFAIKAISQPINDECAGAIFLPNINNYCSGNAAFTNALSTASGFGLPTCWTATATEDVWFTFTATGTDVLISASGSGNGGTMVRPRITIYYGSCAGTINQLGCANGTAGSGTTQLYQGALLPGTVYLIRISTIAANEGSFELCVNNYTPSANPGADCGGAAFLCNDNPVSVPSLLGGGLNNDEPESSSCMEDPFGPDEGNSSWYYWQAGSSGPFAFDILPVNPTDDIDFILYQLNGTTPCGSRTILRCNASACLNINGSTGINYTDTDFVEDINCDPGENAYCAPINMVAGTYYALLVNNFSTSNGYTINFNTIPNGGTIRGPEPVITATPISICAGNAVTFNGNNSSNVAGGLSWNFVNGGSPTSASGTGPHVVTYANPGNYTAILNGTDAAGCNKTESVIITVTASPVLSASQTNVACFGESTGTININVSGGTAGYSYNWGSGVNTEDRTGIPAGSYTVTVTDANLCTTTRSITVTEPATPLTSNTISITNANCVIGGTIDINASGGTAPYTYSWSNGATTQNVSGLSAGLYSVTITDANSCSFVNSSNNVSALGIPSMTLSNTNVLCFGANNGSINITPSGGTAPYTFNWGAGITSEDRTGLSAGTYSVTLTDNNGCTISTSATITEPATALTSSATATNVNCFGGSNGTIDLTASGGTASYSYNWGAGINSEDRTGLTAGTYTVTVTDANLCTSTISTTILQPAAALSTSSIIGNVSCNGATNGTIDLTASGGTATYSYDWGAGINSEDRTGLTAGTYTVTVTDANLCTLTTSMTINEPAVLSTNIISVDNATCAQGGAIDINVNGGTLAYSYIWSNGATTQDVSGLIGGSYSVTITDANACSSIQGPINIISPPAVVINNISSTNTYCGSNSGTINLDVTGGNSPYNYSWSNGITTEDLSGLPIGSYSLTVTDANACTQTVNNIIISGSSAVSISANSTNELCGLPGTGSVNINVNGGTSAYSYLWNNGETNQNISSTAAGTYTVTVTDVNGCSSTASAIVSTPLVPTPNALILPGLTTDTVLALGQSVSLSGGNAQNNVSYSWTFDGPGNSNFSSANAVNSTALTNQEGDYIFILTAQSSDGCVAVDSVFVLFELRDPKIPTAFSPNNGDNNNNSFYVIDLDKSLLQEFKVFNRWGQLVFDDASLGYWDGKSKGVDQPRDVYLYVISWKSVIDGSTIVKRGQVTLMR